MAKIKKSRLDRVCANCGAAINKGDQYSQQTKTVVYDKEGQSINGGKDWIPLRLTKKIDLCLRCS